MCGCSAHVIETASQLASAVGYYGPTLGAAGAAFVGGKFGRLLVRFVRPSRFATPLPHATEQ